MDAQAPGTFPCQYCSRLFKRVRHHRFREQRIQPDVISSLPRSLNTRSATSAPTPKRRLTNVPAERHFLVGKYPRNRIVAYCCADAGTATFSVATRNRLITSTPRGRNVLVCPRTRRRRAVPRASRAIHQHLRTRRRRMLRLNLHPAMACSPLRRQWRQRKLRLWLRICSRIKPHSRLSQFSRFTKPISRSFHQIRPC